MPEAEGEGDLNKILDGLVCVISRRRWWLLLTACITTLATAAVLSRLPNRYTSEATILVVQPQVAERYIVSTTATTDTSKVLQAMTREIMSRPRLLGIINELGLYPEEKKHLAPEELIERMRKDVGIMPLESTPERRDVNAFKISFIAGEPLVAQQVTSKLTSLFIETSMKTRSDQATTTTDFLQERLQQAKTKLTEQDQRLRDFKGQHLGELPEQQQGNLQILVGLQTQLQNAMGNLNRAQQQRLYLQSLITEYQHLAPRAGSVLSSAVSKPLNPIEAAQKQLERLQSEKAALLATSTPLHPDVMRIGREIAKQEALLETLKTSQKPETEKPQLPAASADGVDYGTSLAQLRSQLEANRLEIENISKDEKQTKAAIAQYQNRVNSTPLREQQLAAILREYDLAKQNYTDLLNKGLQSEMATSLEKQQQSQQFRLVEPPSLPTLPSSPKRLKISFGGALAGVFLGFLGAFMVEKRDRSFHTEDDVSRRFSVPLIVGVPPLFTPVEERVRNWKRRFEWLSGSTLVLVVLGVELYVNR